MENITKKEERILITISLYFREFTPKLGIKMIDLDEDKINILLSRPGLFIGKKGRDINIITRILREELENSNLIINLKESNIDNYLYLYEYINSDKN